MSSSIPDLLTAAVLTVSDSSARGERQDLGGPAVAEVLERHKFRIVVREVVPDDERTIREALVRMSSLVRFVVTTGGTGIATRDVTPDATRAVCERMMSSTRRSALFCNRCPEPGCVWHPRANRHPESSGEAFRRRGIPGVRNRVDSTRIAVAERTYGSLLGVRPSGLGS